MVVWNLIPLEIECSFWKTWVTRPNSVRTRINLPVLENSPKNHHRASSWLPLCVVSPLDKAPYLHSQTLLPTDTSPSLKCLHYAWNKITRVSSGTELYKLLKRTGLKLNLKFLFQLCWTLGHKSNVQMLTIFYILLSFLWIRITSCSMLLQLSYKGLY